MYVCVRLLVVVVVVVDYDNDDVSSGGVEATIFKQKLLYTLTCGLLALPKNHY